jgi:hypothetical protein
MQRHNGINFTKISQTDKRTARKCDLEIGIAVMELGCIVFKFETWNLQAETH